MAINIIQVNSKNNTTYSKNRPKQFIEIHYTAGGSSAKGTARSTAVYFGKVTTLASCDFIVDDVETVQFNGDIDNRYCWAVGGGKGTPTNSIAGTYNKIATNKNSIGIELCSNKVDKSRLKYASDRDWYFTKETLNNGLALVKYLMAKYNIPIQNVITHNHVTSKLCPAMWSWDNQACISGYVDFINHLKTNTQYTKTVVPTWKYKQPTPTPIPATPTPTITGYVYNGVDLSPVFSPTYYADKYPDLKKAFGYNATLLFNHFTTCGMNEFRQAIATFNPVVYKASNPDVAAVYGENKKGYYAHYCLCGKNEGRKAI